MFQHEDTDNLVPAPHKRKQGSQIRQRSLNGHGQYGLRAEHNVQRRIARSVAPRPCRDPRRRPIRYSRAAITAAAVAPYWATAWRACRGSMAMRAYVDAADLLLEFIERSANLVDALLLVAALQVVPATDAASAAPAAAVSTRRHAPP